MCGHCAPCTVTAFDFLKSQCPVIINNMEFVFLSNPDVLVTESRIGYQHPQAGSGHRGYIDQVFAYGFWSSSLWSLLNSQRNLGTFARIEVPLCSAFTYTGSSLKQLQLLVAASSKKPAQCVRYRSRFQGVRLEHGWDTALKFRTRLWNIFIVSHFYSWCHVMSLILPILSLGLIKQISHLETS